jgi:RNA polymerase sigma factor (sigma-70 family)
MGPVRIVLDYATCTKNYPAGKGYTLSRFLADGLSIVYIRVEILCNKSGVAAFFQQTRRRHAMSGGDKHNLKPLLTRALAGDDGAWNDFFLEVRKYLHAQVQQILGIYGPVPLDKSAIVQSTLRRVWERIGDQFPDGVQDESVGRFLAWARQIVRNRSWDEVRKPRPEGFQAAGSAIERLADARPQQQAAKRDRIAAAVAAALDRLSEEDRLVVELFWFERLSDAEISQRLGCSAKAARVRRCRTLRKLRSPTLQSLLEDSHDSRC